MLWKQLFKLGLPPKFFSILQQLHNRMQARVLQDQRYGEARLCTGTGLVQSPPLSYHPPLPPCPGTEWWSSPGVPPWRKSIQHPTTPGPYKDKDLPNLWASIRRWLPVLAHSPESMQNALNTISGLYQSRSWHISLSSTPELTNQWCFTQSITSTKPYQPLGTSTEGFLKTKTCQHQGCRIQCTMCLYSALWDRNVDPIQTAYHKLGALPHLPSKDPWPVLGSSNPHTKILYMNNSICTEAALAKKHLRWIGQTICMSDHCLPHHAPYGQLSDAKQAAGRQKRC